MKGFAGAKGTRGRTGQPGGPVSWQLLHLFIILSFHVC